jgi:hypothetical protein
LQTSKVQVLPVAKNVTLKLKLRLPEWTNSSMMVRINGVATIVPSSNGYLVVERTWETDDVLEVSFPLTFRTEKINDDRVEYQNMYSVLYGPYVLAGKWEFTDTKVDLCLKKGLSLEDQFVPITSENKNLISIAAQDGSGFIRHSGYVGWISPPVSLTDKEDSSFRVIHWEDGSVSFESFNYIGHYITNVNGRLTIVKAAGDANAPRFVKVKALNGDVDGFSLVSADDKTLFMVVRMVSGKAEVHFAASDNTETFNNQATFKEASPNAVYHPLSFRTTGCERDLVFFPLNQMIDEKYSVYFNFV